MGLIIFNNGSLPRTTSALEWLKGRGRGPAGATPLLAAAYLPISIHLSLCSLSRRTIDSRTDIFMVEQWGARLMSRQGGGKKEKKVEERTSGEVDREGDDSIDKEKMEKGRERERERSDSTSTGASLSE